MNIGDWIGSRWTIILSNGSEYSFPLDKIEYIMKSIGNKEMIALKDWVINSSFIIEIKKTAPACEMSEEELHAYSIKKGWTEE